MKILVAMGIIGLVVLMGCSSGSSKHDAFAQCLFEKEATMYGADWCSHCKEQKKEFGKSFQYVDYVECDRNRDACLKAGIDGYPTWIIDGAKYPGKQSLERLASLTGCQLS